MNWKKWKDKLKNVYRFQIIDEKSYDVKMVLELNRLNILIGTGLILAIFTFINFIFIAFTPLKQYIPGYGSSSSRKEVIQLNMKTEELESMVSAQQEYITNIKNILEDNITVDTAKVKLKKAKIDTGILNVKTTDEKKFVQELEKGLKYNTLPTSQRLQLATLYLWTGKYDLAEKQRKVLLSADENLAKQLLRLMMQHKKKRV